MLGRCGLKVTTENAWFAARPSGTEDVYKLYAESFNGPDHLARIQAEAREIARAIKAEQKAARDARYAARKAAKKERRRGY